MQPSFRWPRWPFVVRIALIVIIAAPTLQHSPPSQAQQLGIKIAGYQYNPGDLTIQAGTTIIWSNSDNDTHNVAIDKGPELFVSPILKKGEDTRFYFTRTGIYDVFCEWHPQMKSRITVVARPGVSEPAPLGARPFPQTGRSVRGAFLDYWNRNGGLVQQGFPISEEMTEKSETNGKFYTVQYFERAVFEMHPENSPPHNILLSLLGSFEYKRKYPNGAPGQQPNTLAGSQLFRETGKRVGGAFLDYWQKNGGLAQQGLPLSDEFIEKSDLDGKTYRVQYFERAVFEMHPENKPPYDVLLSQLGKFRYDRVVAPKYRATQGIYPVGTSSGPGNLPLLAGPHAAAGLNVWIYDQNPQPVIGWVKEIGAKWVLHQLSWYQIEFEKGKYRWDKIDRAVDEMYRAGINIILHPVHAPPWAWEIDRVGYPTNVSDFTRFMLLVAQRYKGKVAGYQIWNEPNFARETGPYASASQYAAMLKGGYTSVKAVDPNSVVILGALTPTGLNDPFTAVDDVVFLRRLYAYNGGELKGYFDVLGAHPGSNANPPDTLWPEKPGPGPGWTEHPSFYFRRIEQLREVMVENGDAHKQMWLTEFGWMSMSNAPEGFDFARQNSEEEQAAYIGQAFRMSRDRYPWMGPMLLFNLNFALPNVALGPDDERIGWSLLRPDGSKRPAYNVVKEYATGR
jgi:polysaccharide biosynthesis protein PslG